MLVRLQGALGCNDLINQMVLVPQPVSQRGRSSQEINLVVGYNSSPRSQTALDLTLWIAHQTRLATAKQVTVQVVYAVDNVKPALVCPQPGLTRSQRKKANRAATLTGTSARQVKTSGVPTGVLEPVASPNLVEDPFEQADRILWQARCLADEWRGSLKTHLRFGSVAQELRRVVEAEDAALLLLGCESADHPIVQQLGPNFPCSVLGVPTAAMEV